MKHKHHLYYNTTSVKRKD